MYKNVVVGFDGSEQGQDALALAETLTAPNASITAACVYPILASVRGGNLVQPMREAAEEAVDKARSGGRVGHTVVIEARSVAHGLHELAEERDADMVVLGSSRHGSAGTVTSGGVAQALLHGSPCPVAVAPNGYGSSDSSRPGTIGVAFDGSEESLHALNEATALADSLGKDVRMVCVVPPLEVLTSDARYYPAHTEAEADAYDHGEMTRLLDDAPISKELREQAIILEGQPGAELAAAASRFDVLVMGSRGYGPLRRVLGGSTSRGVLRAATGPVLVIPRGARVPSEAEEAAGAAT